MNHHASFNQVFLTDAIMPPEMIVSTEGDGWTVTNTTLMHERRGADGLRGQAKGSDRPGRAYDEERAEIATTLEPYRWYPQRAGRVDMILPRAIETGAIHDPVVRQEVARVLVMAKCAEFTARRARAAKEQGKPQGPEGSMGKLAASVVARAAARVHTQFTGAASLRAGPEAPADWIVSEILISVPAVSIAGGTDEIQRNIIAERVLKMPREPSEDTKRPFRDVPRNTVS
jgi:alkylation response protein AidB-like acyl-CoA dehydrogenase